MSAADDVVVHTQLATWQRRIQQTAASLSLPQTGSPRAALDRLLHQLVSVYNVASGLIGEILRSADSPLATTDTGRAYLVQLATALEHTNRTAAHLSKAVTGLADIHRLAPRPGTAAPAESSLNVTLGHAAALRSLQRALKAVTSPLAGPEQSSGPSSTPVVGQHSRAADAGGIQPSRRRP
ncbi:hypothetical protein [Streptomyces phaeochromogenes]|uniref:hypothetical protein n=1 Tax=Streptomyces phaeochromogenes TaxID=1923 RepID=UPI002DDAD08D|nr:hypothetical protein [Streptomyces phaeochromogenes]WRZ34734.1 hypothetical protein OG931_46885 [Streptomyces phaeochromogenes]